MKPPIFYFLLAILINSCLNKPTSTDVLEDLMLNRGGVVTEVAKNPEKFELQVLYTQIDRDSSNQPSFKSYSFGVDPSTYFYPASTVKLPAAIIALEKLNQLNISGLDRNTPMLTDSAYSRQSAVYKDSTSESGLPSIGHYIKKVFLVSDNDAFNRLYEFIGQGPLNNRLWEMGYADTRIVHRLNIFRSREENRHSNPVRFLKNEQIIYEQPLIYNEIAVPIPVPILKGKGDIVDGEFKEGPKDFATKNAFPLQSQQEILKCVIFPNSVTGRKRFLLTQSDYEFLYQYMSALPRESDFPAYPPETYFDGYSKFLLFGNTRDRIGGNIRIFNKIGGAYGFLVDNAYIIDTEKNIEFFLSAAIYTNDNQTFNDDTYEYEKIGLPFLADLGKMIHEYELNRSRGYVPDLSRFKITGR